MTEKEWLEETLGTFLIKCIVNQFPELATARKLRLFACAVYRANGRNNDFSPRDNKVTKVFYEVEKWADSGIRPEHVFPNRITPGHPDPLEAAFAMCINSYNETNNKYAADLARHIWGNPFRREE